MTTPSARTAKAAYVKAPFQIEFRDVALPPLAPDEVLIEVAATGICGHDMEIAETLATDWRAFGHEFSGYVREAGSAVKHVKVGDLVALESGSYCGECSDCRNGRVDLCRRGAGFWGRPAMGFSDFMTTPAHSCVPAGGLAPEAAALAEPCGVAVDMVKIAEIGITDRVLVLGCGAIGLMALAIARRRTTGLIVAADRTAGKRAAALALGANEAVDISSVPLREAGLPFGGFNKVLMSTPPQLIPDAMATMAYEGYCVYIGFDWGAGGTVLMDTTAMHLGKQQLRASFASPAVYLPIALELLRNGTVPADRLISHRFPMSRLAEAMKLLKTDRQTTRKVVVVPDSGFQR